MDEIQKLCDISEAGMDNQALLLSLKLLLRHVTEVKKGPPKDHDRIRRHNLSILALTKPWAISDPRVSADFIKLARKEALKPGMILNLKVVKIDAHVVSQVINIHKKPESWWKFGIMAIMPKSEINGLSVEIGTCIRAAVRKVDKLYVVVTLQLPSNFAELTWGPIPLSEIQHLMDNDVMDSSTTNCIYNDVMDSSTTNCIYHLTVTKNVEEKKRKEKDAEPTPVPSISKEIPEAERAVIEKLRKESDYIKELVKKLMANPHNREAIVSAMQTIQEAKGRLVANGKKDVVKALTLKNEEKYNKIIEEELRKKLEASFEVVESVPVRPKITANRRTNYIRS